MPELKEDPYFVMPGSALLSLREELQIMLGDQNSKEALFRYGQRCGDALHKKVGIECGLDDFKTTFIDMWFEVGLGRPTIDKVTEEEIVIMFEESLEVSPKNSCDFTRGYISGLVSGLLGRTYACIETTCLSDGAPCCTYVVKPSSIGLLVAEITPVKGRPKYKIEGGLTYLIKEEHPKLSYEVAADASRHGWRGLCITREFPEDVKKKFDLPNVAFFWLTMDETMDYAMPPTDLARIYTYAKQFLSDGDKGFVLLSGIEYLTSQNTFGNVLKFIQLMNDKVAVNHSALLVSLSPLAIEPRELKLLERETHKPPFETEMDDLLGG